MILSRFSWKCVCDVSSRKENAKKKCYRKHFSSVPFFASTIAALSVLWIVLLLVSFVGCCATVIVDVIVVVVDGGCMDIDNVGGTVDVFNGVTVSNGLFVITSVGNVLFVLFGWNSGLHNMNAGLEWRPTFLGHSATILAPNWPIQHTNVKWEKII